MHYSEIMCTVYYIAVTSFGAIILPYSGGLHQRLFTYSNKFEIYRILHRDIFL